MVTPQRLDDYIPFVGEDVITQIRRLSTYLQGIHVQHINSTRLGGGVAELLSRLVPLLNELGIHTAWSVIEGTEDFFTVTKHFHNALHGSASLLSPEMLDVYSQDIKTNADRIDPGADVIIVHDPQPLGLVDFRGATRAHWIWRCHIDVSQADLRVWGFLKPFIDQFDAAVLHIPQFLRKDLFIPQFLIPPFIDPLSDKNRDLSDATVRAVLERYQIATDKPFILQVSRFDRLKDPLGALKAYEIVKRSIDVAFVFVGNFAPDDPEGRAVADEVLEAAGALPDTTVIVNAEDNDITVNALQRTATVVIQKSRREGFGLVVTEAMWKNRPVVGGDTGGISYQIIDGVSGYLVHTVEGGAYRLRQILSNPALAGLVGQESHHRVQSVFLLPHYLRNWLGVLLSFQYPASEVTMLMN